MDCPMRGACAVIFCLLATLALPAWPCALRDRVTLSHTDGSGSMRIVVPLGTALSPGDTVLVGERWF
jgi:hypothetical protein